MMGEGSVRGKKNRIQGMETRMGMTDETGRRRALGKLICAMVIWGSIGVFRRYISMPSALLACARGILGGLFLLLFSGRERKNAGGRLPAGLRMRLIGTGILIGANWILLFEAYNHTTVAVATLCYYMQPTLVTLLSPAVFGEKLTGRKLACAAAALFGMVLVSGVTAESGQGEGNLQGVLLGLGAAALYAGVVILNKRTTGVGASQRTTAELLSAGIFMIPYLLLTGGPGGVAISPADMALTAVMGIVHTGIAYALYFRSMERLKAQTIAVFSYIDPVSALLFSALLLNEPLSPAGACGAVLIIASALISETGTGEA